MSSQQFGQINNHLDTSQPSASIPQQSHMYAFQKRLKIISIIQLVVFCISVFLNNFFVFVIVEIIMSVFGILASKNPVSQRNLS